MAASALTSRTTVALACRLWLMAAMTIALIAVITWLAGPDAARDSLGFTFPTRSRPADFGVAALHNLVLTGAVLVAARHPSRSIDGLMAIASAMNLVLAGLALGGYGSRLLVHAGVYGAAELAAYSLAIAAYINARGGKVKPTGRDWMLTALCVVVSGALETVGAIRV